MGSEESFNYHSGLCLLLSHRLFWAKHASNSEKFIALHMSEVENCLEKIDFVDLLKDVTCEAVVGFLLAASQAELCHINMAWLPR